MKTKYQAVPPPMPFIPAIPMHTMEFRYSTGDITFTVELGPRQVASLTQTIVSLAEKLELASLNNPTANTDKVLKKLIDLATAALVKHQTDHTADPVEEEATS